MNKTMFDEVADMNTTFGNPQGDRNNVDWARLENQAKNIKDEYDELMEAIAKRDINEVRDALCDINVFSLGAHHFIGRDATEDMHAVYESNMSKVCHSAADMNATLKYYRDKGVEVYARIFGGDGSLNSGEYAIVYSLKEQEVGGKVYRKDKFLKNVNWKEPVFKE